MNMFCSGIKHFEIMHAFEWTHADLSLGNAFGYHNNNCGINKSFTIWTSHGHYLRH